MLHNLLAMELKRLVIGEILGIDRLKDVNGARLGPVEFTLVIQHSHFGDHNWIDVALIFKGTDKGTVAKGQECVGYGSSAFGEEEQFLAILIYRLRCLFYAPDGGLAIRTVDKYAAIRPDGNSDQRKVQDLLLHDYCHGAQVQPQVPQYDDIQDTLVVQQDYSAALLEIIQTPQFIAGAHHCSHPHRKLGTGAKRSEINCEFDGTCSK